jgi:L-aminopeptidase/D-esterase-like protein
VIRELELDFPGLEIGIAEYDDGPTGCTVLSFTHGRAEVVHDVRGGSPGVIGTPGVADAICLAGGSAYGLEAACGVQAELLERRGRSTAWDDIAIVHGAIVFDFGRRENAIYPDKELGRRALRNAREGIFPCGPCGAGRSVTVGKTFGFERGEPSGQGAAFRRVGGARVAVFTVVNAFGAVVDRSGAVVRGFYDPETKTRTPLARALEERLAQPPPGNTTLTVVVTDQVLDARSLSARGAGARLDGAGDPAVPRARRRGRAVRGHDRGGRHGGSRPDDARRRRVRARLGRGSARCGRRALDRFLGRFQPVHVGG